MILEILSKLLLMEQSKLLLFRNLVQMSIDYQILKLSSSHPISKVYLTHCILRV